MKVLGRIIAVVVFLGLIGLWIFWPRQIPLAKESDRVMHPEGYSVIKPPDWVANFITAETTINSANRGWLRVDPKQKAHDPTSMVVTVLSQPPDPAKLKSDQAFANTTFHGAPAMISHRQVRRDWVYRVIFQDNGRWFEINLTLPNYEDIPHSNWWSYIDSFRFQPELAKRPVPTSMPVFDYSTTNP